MFIINIILTFSFKIQIIIHLMISMFCIEPSLVYDDYDDDYGSDDDYYYYRKDGSKAKMTDDDVKEIKRETLETKKDK
mgnify:CR=1 FL=1